MMVSSKRPLETAAILLLLLAGLDDAFTSGSFLSRHTVRRHHPPRVSCGVGSRARPPGPMTMMAATRGSAAEFAHVPDEISAASPLRVLIAGGGVGGLALASSLAKHPHASVTVLERSSAFRRFGGPIQLASNALSALKELDEEIYDEIMEEFTFTGDKINGIKDGIRDEWYAAFDLGTPAERRGMPYTGVIDRPALQEIGLMALPEGVVRNGDAVVSYRIDDDGSGVRAVLESGEEVEGDVLIGADGIWSAVRSTMRGEPARGEGSGAAYSGYTLFAGELEYDSFDNGEVGYKVYIGPNQYFVVTDIGRGRYQWYAFLARPPGWAGPDGGAVSYLRTTFDGWSSDVHHILTATREDEIECRDLYDRPPIGEWVTHGRVALIGDSVHAMMPNLGQGGCQAIEDAYVLSKNLRSLTHRAQIPGALADYRDRRLVRSAVVQGLSRFASDIIIQGFDTPAKVVRGEDGELHLENFNYAGIVTRMLQPILPIFFSVQFNFLYDGWRNDKAVDVKSLLGLFIVGGLILLVGAGPVGELRSGLVGLERGLGFEFREALLGVNLSNFVPF